MLLYWNKLSDVFQLLYMLLYGHKACPIILPKYPLTVIAVKDPGAGAQEGASELTKDFIYLI